MIIHCCLSIRGTLENYNKKDKLLEKHFKDCLIADDGKIIKTSSEIRDFFYNELSKGHEVLPFGECDNFDYKTGCKGHEK